MSSLLLSKFSDSYIKGKLRAVSELEQVCLLLCRPSQACTRLLDARALIDLIALIVGRQDMATGVDNSGNKTKKVTLGQKLIEFISDQAIPAELKMRLIMIYLISQVTNFCTVSILQHDFAA